MNPVVKNRPKGIGYYMGLTIALAVAVGAFFGALWFATWAIKGFFTAIGWA